MLKPLYCILLSLSLYSKVNGDTPSVTDSTGLPQLQKQIVCASLRETALMKTPAICDVIGEKEISAVSAVRVSDVLKYIPGMNVEQGTGSGSPFKKNVTINGMPNYYNLILVDGMRLLSSHTQTGVDIDMIPASAIERIEIIKDASSSLYGSDALGGVVNIVTKKGVIYPISPESTFFSVSLLTMIFTIISVERYISAIRTSSGGSTGVSTAMRKQPWKIFMTWRPALHSVRVDSSSSCSVLLIFSAANMKPMKMCS